MAIRGTVKLLLQGSGEDLESLLPKAEGQGQQYPRSSPLTRDNGLTVPQVAMK